MNIVNFNPFNVKKPTSLGDVFDEFFNTSFGDIVQGTIVRNQPALNVKELDDKFIVELAAPGLNKSDFDVKIEKDQLIISSEAKEENEVVEDNYTRREFNYSSFTKSFHLPDSIQAEKIDATYENGVLLVTMPKRKEAQSIKKSIKIS